MNTPFARCEVKVAPELKKAAEEVVTEHGMTMAEFMRLALMNLVATREVPFENKRAAYLPIGRPRGSLDTKPRRASSQAVAA